jgi:hypothetical protein
MARKIGSSLCDMYGEGVTAKEVLKENNDLSSIHPGAAHPQCVVEMIIAHLIAPRQRRRTVNPSPPTVTVHAQRQRRF